jgi:Transglutaminase-like superfamily
MKARRKREARLPKAGRKRPRASRQILAFYSRPAVITSAGKHARLFDELPNDVAGLVQIIQRLVVYDVVAGEFYGFQLPEKRQSEIHIRPIERMLDCLLALDGQKLSVARAVEKRLAGRCRHFVLFLVAALRAKGIPARARCGFGAYFNPPYFEDHWICEYWSADQGRWVLADTQFDDVWRAKLRIKHDILDVPRNQFLVAAEAWDRCRNGEADPEKFGIDFGGLRGLWFIGGSLVRDLAALNKMEMLPWDVWGAQPAPNQTLNGQQLAFFDRLAVVTRAPDLSFADLQALYAKDDRLRVPPTVFNAVLTQSEAIS